MKTTTSSDGERGAAELESVRQSAFDAAYRQASLVYSALIMIVPMLLFVGYILSTDGAEPQPTNVLVLWAFRAVAVFAFFVSFPAGKWIREMGVRNLHKTESAKNPQFGRADALIKGMSAHVATPYAICEIPVLLGFVTFVLYGSWAAFVLLAALTVLGWFAHFPRRSSWVALVDDAEAMDAGYDPIVST